MPKNDHLKDPSGVLTFYVDGAGEHRWRLQARNGEIISAATEGFSSQQKAWGNLFRLGQILGTGDYETQYDRDAPIEAPPDP